MFCAISGEAPEQPVLSPSSGHVFERRLIEKYISDNGKDPINNESMTVEDLIDIKSTPETVKPRPPKLSSVPSLLSALQNEWDSVMLESFTLKQQYQQVRQELSHALYQNDAATRVVARMKKERDSAREALATVQAHLGTTVTSAPATAATESTADRESMEVDAGSLPEEVNAKITSTGDELRQNRRNKKKPPVEFASIESVKEYTLLHSIPSLHATRPPGITALDVSGNLLLTGGVDKHVQVYDKAEDKVVAKLTGHTKKITSVRFAQEHKLALSSSADKHVRVWMTDEKKGYKLGHNIAAHRSDVSGVAVHPSQDYFVSAGLDNKWSFYDFETAQPIVEAFDTEIEQGFHSIEFHPDGMILGAGSVGTLQMWDLRTQQIAARFEGHVGKVNALAFSENGYILASAAEGENEVKIWDLRKLAQTKSFAVDNKVNTLAFDNYGQYLAIGGKEVRVVKAKDGSEIASYADNTGDITGLYWSPLAQGLITSSLDRTVRVYGSN